MVSRGPTFCVTCVHFDAQAAVDGDGTALCPLYEARRHWQHPATVLYLRRKDASRLMPLIDKLQKNHPELEKKA